MGHPPGGKRLEVHLPMFGQIESIGRGIVVITVKMIEGDGIGFDGEFVGTVGGLDAHLNAGGDSFSIGKDRFGFDPEGSGFRWGRLEGRPADVAFLRCFPSDPGVC